MAIRCLVVGETAAFIASASCIYIYIYILSQFSPFFSLSHQICDVLKARTGRAGLLRGPFSSCHPILDARVVFPW